jgi:hypothetical protein
MIFSLLLLFLKIYIDTIIIIVMISKNKDRSHLESGQSNYNLKKKSGRKHKREPLGNFNLDKFMNHLKTENLRTERYASPNKHIIPRKHTDSSKSKKLIKSFESNRSHK